MRYYIKCKLNPEGKQKVRTKPWHRSRIVEFRRYRDNKSNRIFLSSTEMKFTKPLVWDLFFVTDYLIIPAALFWYNR